MNKLRVGWAMTGSYCTFDKALSAAEALAEKFELIPIMSEAAQVTDTRFGAASDFLARLEGLCGRPAIKTIVEAEPVGPGDYFDVLLIAPCTGNTLAKIAAGITDGCVTMAAKSHLRGGKPLLIAFGSNDGLSASAKNIGELLNRKNVYFVPFGQDDPVKKPRSLASCYDCLAEAIESAAAHKQLQPIIRSL